MSVPSWVREITTGKHPPYSTPATGRTTLSLLDGLQGARSWIQGQAPGGKRSAPVRDECGVKAGETYIWDRETAESRAVESRVIVQQGVEQVLRRSLLRVASTDVMDQSDEWIRQSVMLEPAAMQALGLLLPPTIIAKIGTELDGYYDSTITLAQIKWPHCAGKVDAPIGKWHVENITTKALKCMVVPDVALDEELMLSTGLVDLYMQTLSRFRSDCLGLDLIHYRNSRQVNQRKFLKNCRRRWLDSATGKPN